MATWSGPFTAHNAIDCAIIRRDSAIVQTCKTLRGARALVNLLNHAVATANDHGAEISPNSGVTPEEIIAHAVARAFDWCLELESERAGRRQREATEARERWGG
jgi:hypothetical protein